MITKVTESAKKDKHHTEIGKLVNGTLVTEVKSNPDSLYVKVNSRKVGQGVDLTIPINTITLVNIKTGGLRIVDSSIIVRVLEGELEIKSAIAIDYHRV